jgi:carbonic anhydrase
MRRILEGVARFQRQVYPASRDLFRELATQQSPETLLITCSDSRVVPDLIVQAGPGEIFVCRNAGNIAPSYCDASGGVSATIEYAVQVLGVRDIIVCGHSDCGAMKALLHPEKAAATPSLARWLTHAERARAVVLRNSNQLDGSALIDALVEENVLAQIDNLQTHPCVASRLRRGALALHAWVYDIGSGRIRVHDPDRNHFVALSPDSALNHDTQMEETQCLVLG